MGSASRSPMAASTATLLPLRVQSQCQSQSIPDEETTAKTVAGSTASSSPSYWSSRDTATVAILAFATVLLAAFWSSSSSSSSSNSPTTALEQWEINFNYERGVPDVPGSASTFSSVFAHGRALRHEKPVFSGGHKPLFPLSTNDFIGFGCAIVGLMIAAGGGIGGGGMLVPIYILVMGFTPKHAIPLSNVTVLGGALANTILNSVKRHPMADRPLVDWDLVLVMEPLTIAGALIGAFLNKILPDTLLVVMLVALLSATAYTSLKKALKMHRLETRHMREMGLREDGTKESELTIIANAGDEEDEVDEDDDMDGEDGAVGGSGEEKSAVSKEPESSKQQKAETSSKAEEETPLTNKLQQIKQDDDVSNPVIKINASEVLLQQVLEEERHVPRKNVNILLVMFVVVLLVNLVKGGGAFRSPLGITCGSSMFWFANLFILLWIIAVSVYVRSHLIEKFNRKALCGYQYQVGDIRWDGRATVVYPGVCCLAGFFAGMFGIGGGIVKGPLMLAMGVHPAVSSASSACMILFTSFTATTSFIVFGLLVPGYSVMCFGIGFVATMAGQLGLSYIMRKSQRNSYIAFSIGGVVLLSAFMMTALSVLSIAEGEHHSSGGICGKSS